MRSSRLRVLVFRGERKWPRIIHSRAPLGFNVRQKRRNHRKGLYGGEGWGEPQECEFEKAKSYSRRVQLDQISIHSGQLSIHRMD